MSLLPSLDAWFGIRAEVHLFYNSGMRAEVAQQLIDLNRQFYQNAAVAFSASRGQVQPGVRKVLDQMPTEASVLDLGCGNGNLAAELLQRGHRGAYLGVDSSRELLEEARKTVQSPMSNAQELVFMQGDLTGEFAKLPRLVEERFDWIFLLAALHHIPRRKLRLQLLQQVRGLLAPNGRFILSNWQFLNSPKLRTRIQAWETIGLNASLIDEGDYLLDWRSGGSSLRYVHHFNEGEMMELTHKAGFEQMDSFFSDGKLGNLALYQVWTPTA
jgi:SAM-dependent methyltransferase